MRVLMICPELPRSDTPGTMAPGARQIQSIKDLGLDVEVVDMRGIPKLKYLQVIPRVRRLATKVDIIHAHFGFCGWLGLLGRFLKRPKTPLVISFMGEDVLGLPYNAAGDCSFGSKVAVKINRRIAPYADQIIVKSHEMADAISPIPATVIPNGVEIERFRPIPRSDARRELGIDQHKKYVLFPGNPNNPRKGFPLAADAIQAASETLGEKIEVLALHKVQPSEVALYMNACDAMVMTSVSEGSPNVVKEAMACNTPIVGVPVGDVEELLKGVEGCEFVPRDATLVGAAILRVMQASEIGGRKAIFDRGLDLESVARRVVSIYEKALGGPITVPGVNAENQTVSAR